MVLAAAVLLIVLGALLAAFVVTNMKQTVVVVGTRVDIPRGSVITADQLVSVEMSPSRDLKTVPASQLQNVVGRRAATDLHAGGLVSPDSITDTLYPPAGTDVVGLNLKVGQLPAIRPLRVGDRVTILYTPKANDDLKTDSPSPEVTATVIGVSTDKDGNTSLDVAVPTAQANQVATIGATQRVAVILVGE